MGTALVIGLLYKKHDRRIWFFIILIGLAIVTERLADIFIAPVQLNKRCYFIYNLYIPVDFLFVSLYYASVTTNITIKRMIWVTAIIFPIGCLALTALRNLCGFPGLQFNIEGVLNIALALYCLFFLPVTSTPVFRITVFWISLGLLFFHAELFILNGVYDYLIEKKSEAAKQLNDNINRCFNILLYIFFSIGFICGKQTVK